MRFSFKNSGTTLFIIGLGIQLLSGCSSTPPVKTQAYAQLKNERTYEYEFPVVWKGIEEALRKHRIVSRNPEEVNPLELKKITHRNLETDWIIGQSRDKYQEYEVNGFPRREKLQVRFRYNVNAEQVMGGVKVTVDLDEEIQKRNSSGVLLDFEKVDHPDSSRAAELLERIQTSILSAAP